jgi:acyl-CoA synthetase (AMP-forming)/AMP-acid ligase II
MTQTTRVIPAPASWLAPLTPLRFLERSAEVFPTKTAMIEGDRQFSCADIAAAAQQLANALRRRGIGAGDRVAFLAHNGAALPIAHFAVPLTGAAQVALKTRLAPSGTRYVCEHCEASALFASSEPVSTADQTGTEMTARDQCIVVSEPDVDGLRERAAEKVPDNVSADAQPVGEPTRKAVVPNPTSDRKRDNEQEKPHG